MADDSEWPLPSDSRRVRAFFYLADGLAAGGGVLILMGLVGTLAFLLYRTLSDPTATGGVALLVSAFGYILVKRAAAFGVARRTDPDDPSEATDWGRTRDRTVLAGSALFVAAVGVALMVGLWILVRELLLPVALLLPFGTFMAGLTLRLYGFHRLGLRVL